MIHIYENIYASYVSGFFHKKYILTKKSKSAFCDFYKPSEPQYYEYNEIHCSMLCRYPEQFELIKKQLSPFIKFKKENGVLKMYLKNTKNIEEFREVFSPIYDAKVVYEKLRDDDYF